LPQVLKLKKKIGLHGATKWKIDKREDLRGQMFIEKCKFGNTTPVGVEPKTTILFFNKHAKPLVSEKYK
jgi:hypothetical protein